MPPERAPVGATEPLVSAALTRFLHHSPCPYATVARVVHIAWLEPAPTRQRLDALAPEMLNLLSGPDHDLIVLEVRAANRVRGVTDAASLIHALLAGLRERDPHESVPLAAGVADPEWDFLFHGSAFFVSLFAPFYPANHPRSSGEPDVAFIMFQSETSFRRYSVSSRRPNREALSRAVARRFAARGHPYDHLVNAAAPKSLRYVKPIATGDPFVRWWEVPY